MLKIYLFGTNKIHRGDANLRSHIQQLFGFLPVHRDDANLVFVESQAFDQVSQPKFITVEGSVEITDENLMLVANHFVGLVDVSVRFPWGPLVSRKKGESFGHEAIMQAKNALCDKLREMGCHGR